MIRSDFGQSDYTIYLTDLTNVWGEQMDRKSILRRALNTDASIDPSEDASQMRLLLSSIKQAVSGDAGSRADISSSDQGENLNLLLINCLPEPLDDLQWECTLKRHSFSSVTSKVVAPLLATRLHARLESCLLLAQVQQKDTIISKLMAQMQADGSDFGKIFPGAVAARKSHRSNIRDELGKSVAGLAEFSKEALKRDVDIKIEGSHTLENLLALSCPIQVDDHWGMGEFREKSDWWNFPLQKSVDSGSASPLNTTTKPTTTVEGSERANIVSPESSKVCSVPDN